MGPTPSRPTAAMRLAAVWTLEQESHSPVLPPQVLLVDLPDTGAGQGINEDHAFGHCKSGNRALIGEGPHMRDDLLGRDRVGKGGLRNDHGHGAFAPALVLETDDSHFAHGIMSRDEFLDLQGRYPFAAALDHVLDAVGDLKVVLAVNVADIAGMEVAARPELP